MVNWLRSLFAGRPAWMNVLMVFSGYMAFVYVPWDFFLKPVAVDEEVWFGVMFHGWAAKVAEPLHWAVYAAGAYGFRNMKSWMWPWAAVYVGQVAIGMLVWNLLYGVGGFGGFLIAVVAFLAFGALALALWRAQSSPERRRASAPSSRAPWPATASPACCRPGARTACAHSRRSSKAPTRSRHG
jgi:hypothetical protein